MRGSKIKLGVNFWQPQPRDSSGSEESQEQEHIWINQKISLGKLCCLFQQNNAVSTENICFTMASEVFGILMKMGFVKIIVFQEHGTHLQRQYVADMVISQTIP